MNLRGIGLERTSSSSSPVDLQGPLLLEDDIVDNRTVQDLSQIRLDQFDRVLGGHGGG
jgi:hypothetical protein